MEVLESLKLEQAITDTKIASFLNRDNLPGFEIMDDLVVKRSGVENGPFCGPFFDRVDLLRNGLSRNSPLSRNNP